MKESTKSKKIDGKIYLFTNKKNGHQYVGMTYKPIKNRLLNHLSLVRSGAPILVKALKKWGSESFDFEIIDTAKTLGELHLKEIFWIKKLNSKAPNGYNMTNGGLTNEKAVIANKEPILCKTTGKKYESMEDASEATKIAPYLIGFNCSGRQDTVGGMKFEYLDRKKKKKADKKSESRRIIRLKNKTKIKNINTGEIYIGIPDAQKRTGIHRSTIFNCAAGYMDHYKGNRFEYVDRNKKTRAQKRKANRKGNKNV